AIVFEDPAPERLTLAYTLERGFAYGQGPTRSCLLRERPDYLGAAGWMAVGLAQAAVFGTFAAVKWILRSPDRAFMLDRTARGLGKTFWWGPFRRYFYGRTVS